MQETWVQSLRRVPGGGNGNPFQYSCLENPMAWRVTVYAVAKESDTTYLLNNSNNFKPSQNTWIGVLQLRWSLEAKCPQQNFWSIFWAPVIPAGRAGPVSCPCAFPRLFCKDPALFLFSFQTPFFHLRKETERSFFFFHNHRKNINVLHRVILHFILFIARWMYVQTSADSSVDPRLFSFYVNIIIHPSCCALKSHR